MNARNHLLLILCVCCWATQFTAQAATVFTKLVSFNGTNGQSSTGSLCLGSDGKFYGATQTASPLGGFSVLGNVFRMDSEGNIDLVTYFTINIGLVPVGALLEGLDGNYYCTATVGGSNLYYGTIARLTPSGILSAFVTFNGTNGSYPHSDLITDKAGNLYGTSTEGGFGFRPVNSPPGFGTVFKVSTNAEITTLHSFTGGNDGANPGNGLTWGPDGYLYGTTTSEKVGGNASIFRISSSGGLTNLHTFIGSEGKLPYSRLTVAQDGKLYGVARTGGHSEFGTIFSISTNGDFSVVAYFHGTNGWSPFGKLLALEDGYLYGTTSDGGPTNPGGYDYGTIFRVGPDGDLTTLHEFDHSSPKPATRPFAGLIQGVDGRLYGTTASGGDRNQGTVFRISVLMSPILQMPAMTNNTLLLSWKSAADQTYQLQYTTNLLEPAWLDLGSPTTATNGVMNATDTISGPQKYYRVAVLP